jgi:ribonuclease D
MTLITDQRALVEFCRRLSQEQYVTVDTEFLRDKTYWPQLCLLQIAGDKESAAIDALAAGLDLEPVYELMADPGLLKVFHAARQDVEIFYNRSGAVPTPLFDTQIAAMVCGFGESVGYETLVSKLAKGHIDKSSRFTDWSLRPLSRRQLDYALADVTFLRRVYEKLKRRIERTERAEWMDAEMAVLTDPATYRIDPNESWRRLKVRSRQPRFLAVLRAVAAWREREAQSRDVPRNRLLRDEALVEIAAHAPVTPEELARTRGLQRGIAEGRAGVGILAAVAAGLAVPESEAPELPERVELPRGLGPVIELLKVLLKMKCEEHDVAQKLVASSADLELIAADDAADVPALKGWRRELFGADALALKHGREALTIDGKTIRIVPVDHGAPAIRKQAG